jgi:hypothetical protein
MTEPETDERRPPLHPSRRAHPFAARWLAALAGSSALLLALPAVSQAEESNPNNYSCLGHVSGGKPEPGSEEQQVQYVFYCDGPITGYQLESQVQVTGVEASPLVVNRERDALTDNFACSGSFPGYALNCVGSAKAGYEWITGQFAIGKKLCAEPRVDPLLTVTYAYLEKGVVTQAISGPFDLGRPKGCRADASSGGTRLNPKSPGSAHQKAPKSKTREKASKGKKHSNRR